MYCFIIFCSFFQNVNAKNAAHQGWVNVNWKNIKWNENKFYNCLLLVHMYIQTTTRCKKKIWFFLPFGSKNILDIFLFSLLAFLPLLGFHISKGRSCGGRSGRGDLILYSWTEFHFLFVGLPLVFHKLLSLLPSPPLFFRLWPLP